MFNSGARYINGYWADNECMLSRFSSHSSNLEEVTIQYKPMTKPQECIVCSMEGKFSLLMEYRAQSMELSVDKTEKDDET